MSERIRWERNGDGNALFGYVGTLGAVAFRICAPDDKHDDWLLSVRLTANGERRFIRADDPATLKADAEFVLAEFVSSLGAVFPAEAATEISDDEDAEPVEVMWAAGRRVRYTHPDAGYPGEQERTADCLTLGAVYTIAWADIGQSRTDLNLTAKGAFGGGLIGRFNSVFFEPADDEETG
jgi:hypothetical protein